MEVGSRACVEEGLRAPPTTRSTKSESVAALFLSVCSLLCALCCGPRSVCRLDLNLTCELNNCTPTNALLGSESTMRSTPPTASAIGWPDMLPERSREKNTIGEGTLRGGAEVLRDCSTLNETRALGGRLLLPLLLLLLLVGASLDSIVCVGVRGWTVW